MPWFSFTTLSSSRIAGNAVAVSVQAGAVAGLSAVDRGGACRAGRGAVLVVDVGGLRWWRLDRGRRLNRRRLDRRRLGCRWLHGHDGFGRRRRR
jgi:hypothetical protein